MRDVLPSLEIVLSAHATDAVPQDSGNKASASGKHDMTSRTIPASYFIDIVSLGEHNYVLWKPTLHLTRPRARLQRPAVYFTAHLALSPEALSSSTQRGSERLKSFEPLPANVLEPLRFDPALSESNIYLSETRITKVAPSAARFQEDVKPIRGASKRAFPIVPALFTRIRYSALPDAVVASLHLEATQLVNGVVELRSVSLDIPEAKVDNLCPLDSPKQIQGGDEIVLLYKLSGQSESTEPSPTTVFVKIDADILSEQDSRTSLEIKWQAQVDLSQTSAKSVYRWSRPLSGSKQLPARPLSEGAARPPSLDLRPRTATGDPGIEFSFTAAPTVIHNEHFKVNVRCINRSARPRRFALVMLQQKRAQTRQVQPQDNAEDTSVIANLFNATPLENQKPPDVLDLNPDVRIGPLPPGACFEAQMNFRPVTIGPLDLGVIRIVDLDTRQTIDVRELPDITSIASAVDGQRGHVNRSEDNRKTTATIAL